MVHRIARAARAGPPAPAHDPGSAAGIRPNGFPPAGRAAEPTERRFRPRGTDARPVPSALRAGRALEPGFPAIAGTHPAVGDPPDGGVRPAVPPRLRQPTVGL